MCVLLFMSLFGFERMKKHNVSIHLLRTKCSVCQARLSTDKDDITIKYIKIRVNLKALTSNRLIMLITASVLLPNSFVPVLHKPEESS